MTASGAELTEQRLSERRLSDRLRRGGVSGAGGAGFPTYAKWEHLEEVEYLMVNHQESEPVYTGDKWLGRARPEELAALFEWLLAEHLEAVVVSAKAGDREHLAPLEAAVDGTVREPEELPLSMDEESGVVFAHTAENYQLGMSNVLLKAVADEVVGREHSTDRGWLVQNTETLYNVYRLLAEDEPVTDKLVHIAGDVPQHRLVEAPVGTTAAELLEAAGIEDGDRLPGGTMLAHGGPGWCFEIDESPGAFGIQKRTNCLLVLDRETARENTIGNGRINVLEERDWASDELEYEPTETIAPSTVRVPLLGRGSNRNTIQPAVPVVEPGDRVQAGDPIAEPRSDAVSLTHHASIDGTVETVTDGVVEIVAEK